MLKFKAMKDGVELPEAFKERGFNSFVAMADYADKHQLPNGEYWIVNDKGTNLATKYRELKFNNGRFWVEGRGNI